MEDEEMNYGPNGGLVFCMEFLMQNLSWLEVIINLQFISLSSLNYLFDDRNK